ncbi:MAG: FIST N-terminal domain-containing protein [Polyangia bacterium]
MSQLLAAIGYSIEEDTAVAVREAVAQARAALGDQPPSVAFLTSTVDHQASAVLDALRRELPGVAVHGITTSLGVLGARGIVAGGGGAVAVLLLGGTGEIRVVAGAAEIKDDPRAAARAAAQALREAAGGAMPRVAIFNAAPGHEEALLETLAQELPGVPMYGGSAADNAIIGEWSVYSEHGAFGNAISLLGFFGPVAFGGAMRAPYQANGLCGQVTAAEGRCLRQIDGRPAASVLNEWLGGALADQVRDGGNILAQTALRPIGLRYETGSDAHWLSIHPAHIDEKDGSVSLFAQAQSGATLCSLSATTDELIGVMGSLFDEALQRSGMRREDVRAGLLIYCAGCAGAVGQKLHEGLQAELGPRLGSAPLLGLCTFGEQGFVPGIGNLHQDLSVSLLLLGQPPSAR